MPTPGHIPLTNFDTTGRALERATLLESGVPRRTSRSSLPYYQYPTPTFAEMRRAILAPNGETAVLEAAGPQPAERLPDVAVASMGDASMLEAVLGADDRVRVTSARMKTDPWRQICSLRIQSQSGKAYVGTAWFIGPHTLATAGHCVYLQDDGGWPASITVIPARYGSESPFGKTVATRFASVDGWVQQRKSDFDYGVILLDAATVGEQVGNFEVAALSVADLEQAEAQISGYPADRDNAAYQYFHLRPLVDVTDTRLVYDIDTYGGQSGSPVWQDTAEGGVVAVGIHTTGGLSSNSGTRISEPVIENLIRWTE